ncbi:hypothetical protein D3C72_1272500 [compost metagenome]
MQARLLRLRLQLFHRALAQHGHVHGLRRGGLHLSRFLPGQRQQLLHHAGGPVDTGSDALTGNAAGCVIRGASQALHLQAQGRQG